MRTTGADSVVAALGTVCGIWAHPDDESFLMAGLMAVAARNGQTVVCITATKGEAGSQDKEKWPPATMGDVRAAELKKALDILGVEHHYWLDYNDGACSEVDEREAGDKLLELLELYRPDTVITFPPDGITGHYDHIAVSRWTRAALGQYGPKPVRLYYAVDTQERYDCFTKQMDEQFDIYFNVDKPFLVPEPECDLVLRYEARIKGLKCAALAAMPSQVGRLYETYGEDFMCDCFGDEYFVSADVPRQWAAPRPK